MTIHNGELDPDDHRPSREYDHRPSMTTCRSYGRDVESGKRCECAPTQRIVTATTKQP